MATGLSLELRKIAIPEPVQVEPVLPVRASRARRRQSGQVNDRQLVAKSPKAARVPQQPQDEARSSKPEVRRLAKVAKRGVELAAA